MSLLPILLDELDMLRGLPLRVHYHRRPSRVHSPLVKSDSTGFRVSLDVQQFKPDELTVKVSEGYLVVEGAHEEREDEQGYISRRFTRRYKLPEDADLQKLASKLSSDGVLTLEAPLKSEKPSNVREIPITLTNRPSVKQVKGNKKKKTDERMEQ